MKNITDIKEVLQHFVGRKLSDEDVQEYIAFLDNDSNHLDSERKARICTDLGNIVLKNSDLTKRVAEVHTVRVEQEQRKQEIEQRVQPLFLGPVSFLPRHQVNLVSMLRKKDKMLASAPDMYQYLKTLEARIMAGNHYDITSARERISYIERHFPLLTSTRLFYDHEKNTVKMVHNYGGNTDEQVHSEFPIPAQKSGNDFWKVIKQILGTEDSADVIRRVFRLVYQESPFKESMFPNKETIKKITCGTVFFDCEEMHTYKCGFFFEEKWGYGLYKSLPKKK